jgi:hypothetical protein
MIVFDPLPAQLLFRTLALAIPDIAERERAEQGLVRCGWYRNGGFGYWRRPRGAAPPPRYVRYLLCDGSEPLLTRTVMTTAAQALTDTDEALAAFNAKIEAMTPGEWRPIYEAVGDEGDGVTKFGRITGYEPTGHFETDETAHRGWEVDLSAEDNALGLCLSVRLSRLLGSEAGVEAASRAHSPRGWKAYDDFMALPEGSTKKTEFGPQMYAWKRAELAAMTASFGRLAAMAMGEGT